MSTSVQTWSGKAALLAAIAASVGLAMLPWNVYRTFAWPLMLFSTYAHEMGHGLTALLVGGRFVKFEMMANGAGVAYTSEVGRIATALVCAGGLVGPAVLGAIFFLAARSAEWSRRALWALAVTSGLALLLVVRNVFGAGFVIGLGGLSCLLAVFAPRSAAQAIVAFLAVQLSICVYTRSDYLFTETANGIGPSDVALMADALFLPYWFWGLLCAAFSGLVLFWGLRGLLKHQPKAPAPAVAASEK